MNTEKKISPVTPEDTISFQCLRCGDCCRWAKDSVMLEPMDIYRLGRHLRAKGKPIEGTEDVLSLWRTTLRYASAFTSMRTASYSVTVHGFGNRSGEIAFPVPKSGKTVIPMGLAFAKGCRMRSKSKTLNTRIGGWS